MAKSARKGQFRPKATPQHDQPTTPQPGRTLSVPLLGFLVTGLIVIGILSYALLRGNGITASAQPVKGALADAGALHPASSLLRIGSMAPAFHLFDPATGQRYSPETYMGSPIVLEFFAVWCPVCHAEARTIAQITKNYASRSVHVWGVLANPYGRNYESSGQLDVSPATKADLRWYARTYDVHHPQLVDSNFFVTNEYGANAYPTIYVIDGSGAIRYAAQGRQSYATLSKAIGKALRG